MSKKGKRFTRLLKNHQLRMDSLGSGKFGASRSGGKRKHKGVDLIVQEGEPVYAPIAGKVTRLNVAYPHTNQWKGVTIENDTERVKILYVTPFVTLGEKITEGELIGHGQAISLEHGEAMKNHIHVEYYVNDKLTNPTTKLF
jgi:murein DD-endopeptidase MepM/ murein hydrolase activator NlpD